MYRMSKLKEFLDIIFTDIRGRIESEYQHHLTTHVKSISSDLGGDQFTENYGEITWEPSAFHPKLKLPTPLPGRWWIHARNIEIHGYGYTVTIYDNYGQCFTRKINTPYNNDNNNFSNEQQEVDARYQYPLPNSIIDYVKSQKSLTNLYMLADAFHAKMVRSEVKPAAAPPCSKTSRLGEVGSSCCCSGSQHLVSGIRGATPKRRPTVVSEWPTASAAAGSTGSSPTKPSSGWTSSAWMSSSAYS